LFGGGAGAHGGIETGPGVTFDRDSAVLKAGQWFAVVTPGAGGYGPPQKRESGAVARDLAEGVISHQVADASYNRSV
jgi:N-methylhydantoinase B